MKNPMSKLAALALSAAAATVGQAAPDYPITNPADLHWVPKDALPPGAFGATIRGDPHEGPYAFLGRFPARFTVPSHWHTNDVAVFMTEGAMEIESTGARRRIEQGGYFFLPGAMKYIARCEQPCVFLAWGEKPFDIHYERAEDDPRNKPSR